MSMELHEVWFVNHVVIGESHARKITASEDVIITDEGEGGVAYRRKGADWAVVVPRSNVAQMVFRKPVPEPAPEPPPAPEPAAKKTAKKTTKRK
jgi:hypothetical protein